MQQALVLRVTFDSETESRRTAVYTCGKQLFLSLSQNCLILAFCRNMSCGKQLLTDKRCIPQFRDVAKSAILVYNYFVFAD